MQNVTPRLIRFSNRDGIHNIYISLQLKAAGTSSHFCRLCSRVLKCGEACMRFLEVGQRYCCRNGTIITVTKRDGHPKEFYQFTDSLGYSRSSTGAISRFRESDLDIVSKMEAHVV